jgi:hypothetical protein
MLWLSLVNACHAHRLVEATVSETHDLVGDGKPRAVACST